MAQLQFHYVKGPDYRDVPVHGALCGIHPGGEGLFLVMYSERAAIPQTSTFDLLPNGSLGQELPEGREGKEGIVRNMQVCAHFSVNQARALKDLLEQKIAEYEMIAEAAQE